MFVKPKINRKCKACGSVFVPAGSRSFYCSIDCRFWSKVDKTSECWEWTGAVGGTGYGSFGIETKKWGLSHRVAWALTNGDIPVGMYVCHRCDNRGCCRPDHLFLGTASDNCSDMWEKSRQHNYSNMQRGELRHNAKLDENKVREARLLFPSKTKTEIASIYDVDISTISAAIEGKTWAHVA